MPEQNASFANDKGPPTHACIIHRSCRFVTDRLLVHAL